MFKTSVAFLLVFLMEIILAKVITSETKVKDVDLQLLHLKRFRRQIDINLSAEHDDKYDETEIALEAIANLWRSPDSKTQIEGTAKVVHSSSAQKVGNTRFSGRLHVHHDYKRK
ncbi:uncharacterized protein [Eurosta solidaginis]|uniref:uncharacterized protein n=1 Tax=Eurosta solidaginis TaxID=178769 RepID=UPI003530AABA